MAPTEFKTSSDLITALFERYKANMRQVANGILKDAYAAEDAVQNAMIKIIQNIYMIEDIDSRQCRNLIYTIVKNTALDELRKKQNELSKTVTNEDVDFVNIVGEEIDFEAFEADYGFSEEMQKFLSELKHVDKDLICLRYGDGFTDEEISQLLQISTDAVRKRLSRARRRLAEIMEERGKCNG